MPHHPIEHSEEAHDILGRIPGWIVRWGITILFVIFLGIVIGCHFIRYPEVVAAPVTITTVNPPADLMARSSGRISSIMVENGQKVEQDQVIALLYNTADYNSVMAIMDSLIMQRGMVSQAVVNSEWLDREYQLGELQQSYLDYCQACVNFKNYLRLHYIETKQILLKEQIGKNKIYKTQLQKQQNALQNDYFYTAKEYDRDSLLYARGVISDSEYEQAKRSLIQKQAEVDNFAASLIRTDLEILQTEQQLIELSLQRESEIADYERQLNHTRQQLMAQIEQWKYTYVLISPIEGTINFTRYWSENQSVSSGDRIATVVPEDNLQVIGRMAIPSGGFGRVETGQTVNVKINGYPYMEFGMLKGIVRNISDVPDSDGYIAEVVFPGGMTTTYNKELRLIQQMDGTGEIITKNLSLLQRFVQPIRALFDK